MKMTTTTMMPMIKRMTAPKKRRMQILVNYLKVVVASRKYKTKSLMTAPKKCEEYTRSPPYHLTPP